MTSSSSSASWAWACAGAVVGISATYTFFALRKTQVPAPIIRFGTAGRAITDDAMEGVSRHRERKHLASMSNTCPIIVTEHADEYREAVRLCVLADDAVLEVGCHQGVTTEMIRKHCRLAVGVDKSEGTVSVGRERYPELEFHVADGLDIGAVRRALGGRHFQKIFLDVSGSVEVGKISSLIHRYEAAFRPNAIIVKSFQLVRMLNACHTPTEYAALGLTYSGVRGYPNDNALKNKERKLKKAKKLTELGDDGDVNDVAEKSNVVSKGKETNENKELKEIIIEDGFNWGAYNVASVKQSPVAMSRALTLWSATTRALGFRSNNKKNRRLPAGLSIQLLGLDSAEGSFEFLTSFYELCAMNGVKRLSLSLIGPNLDPEVLTRLSGSSTHADGSLSVTIGGQVSVYHESDFRYAPTDLVMLFNAGLWGYDSWKPTLEVLAMKQCVCVVTSYNRYEADEDFDVVCDLFGGEEETGGDPSRSNTTASVEGCDGVEWLWKPEQNIFASTLSRDSGIEGRPCVENESWHCWKGK